VDCGFLVYVFCPEDGGGKFIRKVSNMLQDCEVSQFTIAEIFNFFGGANFQKIKTCQTSFFA
jgi:hypothetical protein